MRRVHALIIILLSSIALTTAGCNRPETLSPEAASARGDALLHDMSRTLAATQAFSYTAEEHRERVRDDGSRSEDQFTRRVIVRRPNAVAFVDAGGEHDAATWYDGKTLTFVSNRSKAWARGPMPATLDEAMDFVSAEYAVQFPTADLLYSSPYDALMTPDTKGGWVDVQKLGDTSYDHLAYHQPAVDWEIWLTQDDRKLPKQVLIKYKNAPGQPQTRVVFSDWNPSAQVSDQTFAAKVPDGYERLKLMRYATVDDQTVTEAAPPDAAKPPGKPPTPR